MQSQQNLFAHNPHIKRSDYANQYQQKFSEERARSSMIPNPKFAQSMVAAPVASSPPMVDKARYTYQGPSEAMLQNKSMGQPAGSHFNTMPAQPLERPSEFVYQYDMDENGALFFLGSFAKKRLWQNPHSVS